jgi:hypothetical protein
MKSKRLLLNQGGSLEIIPAGNHFPPTRDEILLQVTIKSRDPEFADLGVYLSREEASKLGNALLLFSRVPLNDMNRFDKAETL